jgi:hypothetical protein
LTDLSPMGLPKTYGQTLSQLVISYHCSHCSNCEAATYFSLIRGSSAIASSIACSSDQQSNSTGPLLLEDNQIIQGGGFDLEMTFQLPGIRMSAEAPVCSAILCIDSNFVCIPGIGSSSVNRSCHGRPGHRFELRLAMRRASC